MNKMQWNLYQNTKVSVTKMCLKCCLRPFCSGLISTHVFCRRVHFIIVVTAMVFYLLRDHQSACAEHLQATILLFLTWDLLRVSVIILQLINYDHRLSKFCVVCMIIDIEHRMLSWRPFCHRWPYYRLSLWQNWHHDDSRFSDSWIHVLTRFPQGCFQWHHKMWL